MGLTRLFGGVTGISNQPQGLDIGISGSNIKSIQRGTVSVSALSTNVTISAVDTSKSIVKISYTGGNSNRVDDLSHGALLTSSTNINIAKTLVSGTVSLAWEVIEFNNVKSKQQGSQAIANINASANVTISNVDLNKTTQFCTFSTTDTSTAMNRMCVKYDFASSTQLRISGDNNLAITLYWQIIEFN